MHYFWCSLAAGQLSLTSLGVVGSSHTSLGHSFGNTVVLHSEIWNVGNKPFKTANMKETAMLGQAKCPSGQLWMHNDGPLD